MVSYKITESFIVSPLAVRGRCFHAAGGPFACAGATSEMGHSRPMDPAPIPTNVRYAPNSDHSRHESELTRCAISRHLPSPKFSDHSMERSTILMATP